MGLESSPGLSVPGARSTARSGPSTSPVRPPVPDPPQPDHRLSAEDPGLDGRGAARPGAAAARRCSGRPGTRKAVIAMAVLSVVLLTRRAALGPAAPERARRAAAPPGQAARGRGAGRHGDRAAARAGRGHDFLDDAVLRDRPRGGRPGADHAADRAGAAGAGIIQHRTVLIGGGPLAAELCRVLQENPRYGLPWSASSTTATDCVAEAFVPQLGGLADLDDAVLRRRRRRAAHRRRRLRRARAARRRAHARPACRATCWWCRACTTSPCRPGCGDHIGSIPVMRIRTPNLRGPARVVKRGFDVVVSGVAAGRRWRPVIAVCALAVRLEGGPGVIFRQPRVGRDGVRVRLPEAALDAPGRRDRVGDDVVDRRTTTGSARSAGSCAARRWTSCRSCGTSCAAT